ncbi:hypothetical protein [Winogradskya humida]|nr:hypothetical protein [Actinoplanes humidus]
MQNEDGRRRPAAGWSARDRIVAVAAGTGAATVVAIAGLALADAPTAAYGAAGAVGASALTAVKVYLGRKPS